MICFEDVIIRAALDYYMEVFSRTVGEENIGIIIRSYDGDVLSVNSRFLTLAGVPEGASSWTISDMPWRNLKPLSDAADILARSGDVKEAVNLYFHPIKQDWVHAVSVKFSHQPTAISAHSSEPIGEPVIYILMMDVTNSTGQLEYKKWLNSIRVDYEKERIFFTNNSNLSRSDLICLSYYLEDMSQTAIAEKMNQSVKTVEGRIANIKSTLLALDPQCENLYSLCRKHGLREMLEVKRDWFDKQAVAATITNMQWLNNQEMRS